MSNSTQANDAYMQWQQKMRRMDAKVAATDAGLHVWEVGDQVDVTMPTGDMYLVRVKAMRYNSNHCVWDVEFETL